ncbi:MAG: DNA topoisomerase I, partial [Francisellaceae bacterium]|nr:DNA topoisomerase I [Francisellaceae bacterium]
MAKHLLIVESPAKAKTLKKYLGDDFTILASYGHVRDLIPKEGAVKPDEDFAMTYALIDKNSKHVDKICKELKDADDLYLATDPDREGEAISWHLHEIIKSKRGLKNKPMYRVAFYEITKKAVQEAVANPRELAIDLIHAQQARRALDYLVGFNLSPLLWKKIRRGLSAGRVQSPALRLIAERELDIEKFISQEYWTIAAKLEKEESEFKAKLTHYQS